MGGFSFGEVLVVFITGVAVGAFNGMAVGILLIVKKLRKKA